MGQATHNRLFLSIFHISISASLHNIQTVLLLFLSYLSTIYLHIVMNTTVGRSYYWQTFGRLAILCLHHMVWWESRFWMSSSARALLHGGRWVPGCPLSDCMVWHAVCGPLCVYSLPMLYCLVEGWPLGIICVPIPLHG